jgi:putative transposase
VKLKKLAHTVYRTQYHIVWITRYRRKILVKGVRNYLEIKLQEIRKYYPEWEYIEIGINSDHVHLYMIIPPKYAVSKAVETIKKNTSRLLRKKFRFLDKAYWDDKGIWGKGYFVSTVGINEGIIRKYIGLQEKEDAGQAQLEL